MDGSEPTKTRTCPVCDEKVSMDTKMCPSCSTDLSLFSAEESVTDDIDSEELKMSLMSDGNGHLTDLLKAAEDDVTGPSPKPVEIIYEDSAECPECRKSIPADAMACPHCGVQFEMEEVFECPMCKALLEVTVTKCPSCGTEFEDEPVKDASPPPVEAPKPVPEPKPEPVPEKKAEPLSFAERLKQVKEEPGPAPAAAPGPKKELSFAERMKAMKEGKQPEVQQPQPTSPVQPPAEEPPKPIQTTTPQTTPGSISDRVKNLAQVAAVSPAPAQPTPQPQQKQAAPTAQPTKAEPAKAPTDTREDQYKELPRYIAEVKVLLLLANELKIDVSTSKAVINKAVSAGKSRDLDNAIKLVKEGKMGIEKELKTVYTSKIRTLETALSLEKKSGKDVKELESRLNDARKELEAGDFKHSSETLKSLEELMMRTSSGKISQVEMDTVSCALDNAKFLRLNVSEAKAFYDDARVADDPQKSIQLTKQATESLNKILPPYIAGEMRTAKITLREIKMMNVDITAPVQMLKEANDDVLRGDYCSALSHIKRFKEYVQNVEQ